MDKRSRRNLRVFREGGRPGKSLAFVTKPTAPVALTSTSSKRSKRSADNRRTELATAVPRHACRRQPLLHWTGVYAFRFCPDCGARLDPVPGRAERLVSQSCAACGAVHFRNAKPCAGALVVRDGKVLLGRRAVEPGLGCWTFGRFPQPVGAPGRVRRPRSARGDWARGPPAAPAVS
jgi:NADH pyrophosphatase NudC (nudix superfamily)